MKHIMAILISVFSLGYHGKTIDFEKYSPCHRTTIAHFLNKGKWDDARLEDLLKSTVIQIIYKEARRSGKPVFCIVDDTISSKTKPSSQALHPIQDAYFHMSHLKGKQDYGHQAVAKSRNCPVKILCLHRIADADLRAVIKSALADDDFTLLLSKPPFPYMDIHPVKTRRLIRLNKKKRPLAGRLYIALAIDTLCCYPPDNSPGR